MKYIRAALMVFALLPVAGISGSGSGTGTPPALQDIIQTLSKDPSKDILLEAGGTFMLGTSMDLDIILPVLKAEWEKTGNQILLSAASIEKISPTSSFKRVNVGAINLKNETRSYVVEDGASTDNLLLIDRRALIRSNVKYKIPRSN